MPHIQEKDIYKPNRKKKQTQHDSRKRSSKISIMGLTPKAVNDIKLHASSAPSIKNSLLPKIHMRELRVSSARENSFLPKEGNWLRHRTIKKTRLKFSTIFHFVGLITKV